MPKYKVKIIKRWIFDESIVAKDKKDAEAKAFKEFKNKMEHFSGEIVVLVKRDRG